MTHLNKKLIETWSSIARTRETLTGLPSECHPITLLIKNFSKNFILDAGCGGGSYLTYLALHENEVIGIDISKHMLLLCEENVHRYGEDSNVGLILSDVRKLPFRKNIFDVILSFGVIEHFPESGSSLKEHVLMLKKGGLAIVCVPNLTPFYHIIRRIGQSLALLGYEDAYSKKTFVNMLGEAQLSDIHIMTYGFIGRPASLRKLVVWMSRAVDQILSPFIGKGILVGIAHKV